jgi:Tol biopolymer transport system component
MNEASLTGNVADESYIDLINPDTGEIRQLSLTDWNGPYTAIDWLPDQQSFLVGQAADVLAHVSGSMGQIMLYDIESEESRPLFWSSIRVPRQGWNTSSLNLVAGDRIVFDDLNAYAELWEIALASEDPDAATRVLTSGLAHDRQPAYSPDGRQVIFSTNRSGNVDLWTVDRVSGEIRQLTDDPADDWDPAFTPDGRSILWSSNRSGNLEIWMATAEGSHARQVTRDGVDAENPTMTPDGRWIVYTSSNDAKLGVWKIHPDGTGASLLAAGNYNLPEVSPDGRYALYSQFMVQNTLIQVVEIESGELVDFAIDASPTVNFRNTLFGRARWMDGNRTIIYVGQDEQEHSGVFAHDFVPGQDTSASRRKIAGFAWEYVTESLGISPDGEYLVISARFDRQCLKLAELTGLLDH